MSAILKESGGPGNWKEKYQQALKEIDARKQEWKNEENSLYKSILRLILSHAGVDSELDKEFESMRNTLRKGADDSTRKKIIANVIEKTIIHERNRNKEQGGRVNSHLQLSALIGQLELPEAYMPELDQIDRSLSHKNKRKHIERSCARLAGIINKACESTASWADTNDIKNGLVEVKQEDIFEKFLQRFSLPGEAGLEVIELRKRAMEIHDHQERLEFIDEFIQLLQHLYSGSSAAVENTLSIDFDHLRDALFHLIEWLPLTCHTDKKVKKIKGQLHDLSDETGLKNVLRNITALINDHQSSLQKELNEIQSFLKKVTLRLKDLETHIHEVAVSELEARGHSESLRESVRNNVYTIRDDIEQADSIKNIKQCINQRLIAIEQSMDTFLESEQTRRQRSEKHVKKLSKRIIDMKAEACKLQTRIREERYKAQIDALTGIPNRLAHDERMQQEFNRWQRYGQSLSLCVIDIDKFKNVNDSYGHKAGDKVLVTVAELCSSRIRDTDFFSRYGGEEFVLLLPGTALAQAQLLAENLRRDVDECDFHYAQEPVAITISCGLVEFREGDTTESAFKRADRALYAAKHAGRNRCMTEAQI